MNYLKSIGKNAKKAFEDLKVIKHKKIKKVLENYNQSLLRNIKMRNQCFKTLPIHKNGTRFEVAKFK